VVCTASHLAIGVCYGCPLREEIHEDAHTALLRGIAVIKEHSARGHGTQLLRYFEQQAANAGFHRVTVGSAGGYVERFYTKNGYRPVRFLVQLAVEDGGVAALRDKYDVAAERVKGTTRYVYVRIESLDESLRRRLREDSGVDEVTAIMDKDLRAGMDPATLY